MRKVGIREFRDKATTLLATGETLLVERHGHPVGYFVPIKQRDPEYGSTHERLAAALERVVQDTGLTEEALAELFTLRRTEQPQ